MRYGGNTTCLELRSAGGAVVVIDAGTGIRDLGLALAAESLHEIDLLLTHLHLDHIEGLGFFALLFDPECTIRIHGPRPLNGTLEEKVAAYLSPPYFPVPFELIDANMSFEELETDRWEINGLRLSSAPVCHPGATLAYRIEEHGSSLAFVPDNEPGLEADSGLAIAGDADVLLHDAQYTDEEYATRVGWGHTSLSDFVAIFAPRHPRAPSCSITIRPTPTTSSRRCSRRRAVRPGTAISASGERGSSSRSADALRTPIV